MSAFCKDMVDRMGKLNEMMRSGVHEEHVEQFLGNGKLCISNDPELIR